MGRGDGRSAGGDVAWPPVCGGVLDEKGYKETCGTWEEAVGCVGEWTGACGAVMVEVGRRGGGLAGL